MLYQPQENGVILITQPSHAWVSGQLSRAWGNEEFAEVPDDVSLAAEQHDIGFLQWEQSPTLNASTGLPHTFLELPTSVHLELWTTGVKHMLRFGRLPALLVSMHFTNIVHQHRFAGNKDKHLYDRYLEEQEALQTTIITSLANDFHYGPWCDEEQLRRFQQLVSIWDWISLLLCFGSRERKVMDDVPRRFGAGPLELLPLAEPGHFSVNPWPFRKDQVTVVCEGRRLLKTYTDESQMQEAIRGAAPLTLLFQLARC